MSRGSHPRQSSRDSRWHILNLVTQRPVSSALFSTYSLNCVFWYLHIPSVVHCGPYVGASSLAQATSSEQFAMDLEPSFRWCTHRPETLEIQHDCGEWADDFGQPIWSLYTHGWEGTGAKTELSTTRFGCDHQGVSTYEEAHFRRWTKERMPGCEMLPRGCLLFSEHLPVKIPNTFKRKMYCVFFYLVCLHIHEPRIPGYMCGCQRTTCHFHS